MGPPIPAGAARRTAGYSVLSPFSIDEETFRALGHRLVDTLAAYLDRLPREPVCRPSPARARREGDGPGSSTRRPTSRTAGRTTR
jgi:hypothetical protein